ncbi:MAG: hypothetical protein H6895_00915 [Defluviimonas sp.]|nr:hypothetical protein [Paracoccaceae bacterium]MCC0062643.1 hypothetical protein [Defluviimonas sp.]
MSSLVWLTDAHLARLEPFFPESWFDCPEQVPGVFQVVFRLVHAATASGVGWLK